MVIEVCAGVILRNDKVLVCSRPKNSELAGFWEFPGGKVEKNETIFDCIVRELIEELSVTVTPIREIACVLHEYPNKTVRLHFIECAIEDNARIIPNDNQDIEWVERSQLEKVNFLQGDKEFVKEFANNTFF